MALVILLCALSTPLSQCTFQTARSVAISSNDMSMKECLASAVLMNVSAKQIAGALVKRGENVRIFCAWLHTA